GQGRSGVGRVYFPFQDSHDSRSESLSSSEGSGDSIMDVGQLKFDAQGLIPAVVQDWLDGTVLMVAFMNQEALQKTIETKSGQFWSRSRQTLWEKGETSGHRLQLKDLFLDCAGDALFVDVDPVGSTCHTGGWSL